MNNHSVSSFNKLQRPLCTWLFASNYHHSLLLTYTHIRTCSHTRVRACLAPTILLTHCLNPPQLCTALHLSSMSGLQELTFLKEQKVFILTGKPLVKSCSTLRRVPRLRYHRIDLLTHNAISILHFSQVMYCKMTE